MASTAPAKSKSLHNFDLPSLKWNKDGNSSGQHKRRRSIKSPSRRHTNTSSPSPVRQSPLRDSVSATPPRRQSPSRDPRALTSGDSPVHGDHLMKQSPIRGESSKASPIQEWMKHSLVDGEPERLSTLQKILSVDLSTKSGALRKGECALIEYRRNHSRNFAFDSIRNGVHSSTSEQPAEKPEKRPKETEVDVAGNKRSKILIKIPCKNNKLEDENPEEEPQKDENPEEEPQRDENPEEEPQKEENNGEHGDTDEVQEEGKTNNNIDEETKTWNLRPRKPISKKQNVTVGAEKGNVSGTPEKNKAMKANRSGQKEGNCNSSGGEKKGGGGGVKKEKRKLSIAIALSKEEIEDDIFALTGSKPARRPKKRAKNIQKQVDFVFPGLWLISITPDSYKVSENSLKG